ncbi:hypothetical protein [Bifidobacterium breve]|uniref:hypothetical protein n=1 Tax=Bifidobacterium breve TaxID=1685 RepID=UPI0010728C40|nr:hypothetical protein [Bifidobacterium breve]
MSSGWSGEKEDWARDLHEDVLPAYERLASSGILRLTCFGRPNIDILFPRYRFPHLVGLSYYSCRDKKRRVKIPDREFYKLIGDGDVDTQRMDYTHERNDRGTNVHTRHDNTSNKMTVALRVFLELRDLHRHDGWEVDSAIVDSGQNPIVIFTGTSSWALGLCHQMNSNGKTLPTYIPRSLVKEDVRSSRNMKKGTTASRVIFARWI